MGNFLLNIYEAVEEAASTDSDLRDENRTRLNNLAQQAYGPEEPITEDQSANNAILLLAGEHSGFSLARQWTNLRGAPGALVKDKGVVGANCLIENLEFRRLNSSETNEATLLHIKNNAKVLIRNCVFQRRASDPSSATVTDDDSFILIESGCKVIITNCVFRSDTSSGAMNVAGGRAVKNRGAAGNVYVGTGFNLTGQAHLNVTAIVPELT